MILADVVSLFAFLFTCIPFIGALFLRNMDWFIWGCIVTASNWINSILKYYVFTSSGEIFRRPKGAHGCDAFNMDNFTGYEGRPGFPSGHMAITSSFFLVGYFVTKSIWFVYVGILGMVLMGWARTKKRCHNIYQVVAGVISGLASGFCLWLILAK